MSTRDYKLLLEGRAFGVEVWREAGTGLLLVSRGASEPEPLDWQAWVAAHPGGEEEGS